MNGAEFSGDMALTVVGEVARITLCATENDNALSTAHVTALAAALDVASARAEVRVLVLDSRADSFCRGLDLGEGASAEGLEAFAASLRLILTSKKPVVAVVAGPALGGGLGLAAACDLVVANETASFGLPEVIFGMIPAMVAPVLARRIGVGRAAALALGSRTLDAREALLLGLVDIVAADAEKGLTQVLGRLLRSSPSALGATKSWFRELSGDAAADVARGRDLLGDWLLTPDPKAGARAFRDGESPPWFSKPKGKSA